MEWIVVLLALIVVVIVVRSNNQKQLAQHSRANGDLEQLTSVKKAADEDITVLGEELQRLDVDVAGHPLDEAATADYQRALDAYEAAKESLSAVQSASEITNVASIVDEGRYAIACVRARVASEPLPPRRPPCFFNPQHGQSTRDVEWAPVGGAPRAVPACDLDADRVDAGAEPDSRKVMLGTRRVPYWEAGPAFGPFTVGYFGAFGIMNAVFAGTMMSAVLGGFGGSYGDGYDAGYDDGQGGSSDGGSGDSGADSGASGFDGGGFEGGGGWDGGGFDGGGF